MVVPEPKPQQPPPPHTDESDHAITSSIDEKAFEQQREQQQIQRAVVTQVQFLGWPDYNVPENPDSLLRLIRLVNREQDKVDDSAPVVVHCSAGCGRTGTYCVIDTAIATLTATQDGN